MSTFLLMLLCLLSCFLNCSASSGVKAEPGHDVTLPCQGPRDADIEQLEWTKADLGSDIYVFFFRDNQRYDDYQLPSFHGRVKLRDPTMTDGDVSVILRNVTDSDAGTYECYVGKKSSKHDRRSASELISSVTLKVEHSEHTDVTAQPGQRIVLPCISNGPVTGVEWIQPDLIHAGHVFMSKDGKPVPNNQHPLYKDWVELKDTEMKDGDVSLVLKNVTPSDSGTYKCRVIQRTKQRKRGLIKIQPISTINLDVRAGHSRNGGDQAGGD